MHLRFMLPCLILGVPSLSMAAEPGDTEAQVYQVVVTAQKRETALQADPAG